MRKRFARPTLCAWIASTPTSSSSSSAGAWPTHENQAGETSKRRAPSANRSGPPYDARLDSAANHPARTGVNRSAAAGRTVISAHPRGPSSHL